MKFTELKFLLLSDWERYTRLEETKKFFGVRSRCVLGGG